MIVICILMPSKLNFNGSQCFGSSELSSQLPALVDGHSHRFVICFDFTERKLKFSLLASLSHFYLEFQRHPADAL